jgi:hypothetical protein
VERDAQREAQREDRTAETRRALEQMEDEPKQLRARAATMEERPVASERGNGRRRAKDGDDG